MKHIFVSIALLLSMSVCYGQYNKEKLTDILTGGSSKTWTVKTASAPEKSFTFNKDLSVAIARAAGSKNEKWELSSPDQIRWFITIAGERYELIVSYDKAGKQFVKLVSKADKSSIYAELLLYP